MAAAFQLHGYFALRGCRGALGNCESDLATEDEVHLLLCSPALMEKQNMSLLVQPSHFSPRVAEHIFTRCTSGGFH